MPITVYLSGHLKSFTGGKTEIVLASDPVSVADALDSHWIRHPALRDRIIDEQDEVRQHVNIFLGSDDIKRRDGLETRIGSDDIHIFNAVSGG